MDNRYIELDGTYNFRDIGGYITSENLRIKYGKLYRSDELSKLTPKDVSTLEGLNIRTIIDYRNEYERKDNEDVRISGATIHYLDPIANIAALASAEYGDQGDLYDLSKLNSKLAEHLMIEQNKEFVRSKKCKEVFSKMFELLLDEDNCAIVQHCRGGKDRTGYGVALILLILGVYKEDVIKDYLLTNKYKSEKNEKSLAKVYQETGNEDIVKALRYLKEANEEFLLTALDIIDVDFGGVKNYVKSELSLNENDISTLKKIYLEE